MANTRVNTQNTTFAARKRLMPSASAAAPSKNRRNHPGRNSSIWWEPVFCTRVNSTRLTSSSAPARQGRAGRRRFAANHSPIPMRMKFSKPMRSVCAASSSVMPPKL